MDYLIKLRNPLYELQIRISQTQANLREIRSIMNQWSKSSLFERKDSKKDAVLCLEERCERINKRYSSITTGAERIQWYY